MTDKSEPRERRPDLDDHQTAERDVEQDEQKSFALNRRTVLRSVGAASAAGLVGVPAISGSALAQEELCQADVMIAVDRSGSIGSGEVAQFQAGVNALIDEIAATGADVLVGSLQFGQNQITAFNDLQDPSGLSVVIGSTGGNTPMPPALDIADQNLYGSANARAGADKIIILVTDGGPNYLNQQYMAGGFMAPRDDTTNWSDASGDAPPAYDNGSPTDNNNVTVGEMDETDLVADSIKDGAVGGGATTIVTVFASDSPVQAMTGPAQTKYTDLPTYLAENIASSPETALDTNIENLGTFTDELITALNEACLIECDECPEDFYLKYEWVEDEEAEGECKGEFVVFDADDNEVSEDEGLTLVSVTCDEDGEPQEACFETDFCELDATVKAGRGTEDDTVSFEGDNCVTGITTENPNGKERTHAISNIVFTCPEAEE